MEDIDNTSNNGEITRKSSTEVERDEHGRIKPGQQSLNPKGRPKGKTIKERVRDFLEENPESMENFVKHFIEKNRELAWQMLEGKPSQEIDAHIKGELKLEISEDIANKHDIAPRTEANSTE